MLDATDPHLKPLNGGDGDIDIGGQIHDALATADSKYAIMTLRTLPYKDDLTKMDGRVQLYDLEQNISIGQPVSVCNACHEKMMGQDLNAVLCGLDGVVKPQ